MEIDKQVDLLVQKVHHYLITVMGRYAHDASPYEFYRAFSYALREQIMINWVATTDTINLSRSRVLYYLSMEYLPGRILGNNVSNLNANEWVAAVMKKMHRNWNDIVVCEPDPGLGNGGLGRLASCFLDSLATQRYPARAYGLRYQYGIFEQSIKDGLQVERPDCWLLNENPWEFRRDSQAVDVKFNGTMTPKMNQYNETIHDLTDYEKVHAIPYDIPIVGYAPTEAFSVLTLRLWTTRESPYNFQLQRYNAGHLGEAGENTNITNVLYPNDNHETGLRIRLKQEFLLVAASLQDIITDYCEKYSNFDHFADKVRIQINDTHPSLAIVELVRILTKRFDLSWDKAWEITRSCISYTNHTVLKEALEEWNRDQLYRLLPRQYEVMQQLNMRFCNEIRRSYPNDEDRVRRMSILEGRNARMANLALYGAHKVNGVAAIHTDILKQSLFKDFYELYPEKFINITNGITQRRWLLHCNPPLSQFITERIGDTWITDFSHIQKLQAFASDPRSQQEFLAIKQTNKQKLVDTLLSHDPQNSGLHHYNEATQSLFDVQVKRIHEYKRQLMNILHVLMLINDIKNSQARIKRTVILAGKAAPGYDTAKHIILLTHCVARYIKRNSELNSRLRLVFIENYNVSKAQLIIPAAELSEQISTAGMEASGTGNMKMTINGALTIGTNDGANIEMREDVGDQWWPFLFGASANEIETLSASQSYSPMKIYESDDKISKAIDYLHNGSLSDSPEEQRALDLLHHLLLNEHYGQQPDRFFVLKDLRHYYEVQREVDALYQQRSLWAEYAINNIAGMGRFSVDRSIQEYATQVWGIDPIELRVDVLDSIRKGYETFDSHYTRQFTEKIR